MNKVILNFGLLIFCFTLIFFSQRGMPILDVLLKSSVVFVIITIVLSVVALFVIRFLSKSSSINSTESKKA